MTPFRTRCVLSFLFIATVFAANWAINHIGTEAFPGGPHTIPVWPGLAAPSGVLFAGLGFTLRDALHEAGGRAWVVACIVIGAAASYFIAPTFAVASGVAFLFSETADFLVYSPLRDRQWTVAVLLSGFVGAVVDSVLFLHLAFHDLTFLRGQVVGKFWMVLLALPIAAAVRRSYRAQHLRYA